MNTTSKLLSGLAVAMMFASCSSDEPTPAPEGPITGGGQKAYMSIKISPVGENGRSTDFDTPSFDFGNAKEHAVDCAKFFFFDENGNSVLEAKITNPSFGDGNKDENDNIEYLSTENVLVLEDLTGNAYPTYMLTVLNMPDFEADETLELTQKKLSKFVDNFYYNETDQKDVCNFVMTTTSYFGASTNHSDTYYSVTMLDKNDFKLTASEAQQNAPVDVYVERLAAKVQLTVAAEVFKTLDNGTKLYKLDQTVAGDANDQNNGQSTANSPIYLTVLGWSLNATANDSYMSKILKPEWAATAPFANWNDKDRFRSYWGVSKVWDTQNYDNDLKYVYFKDVKGTASLDYAQYCYENTNAAAKIFAPNSAGQNLVETSKVTHAVLATQIVNENGDPVNMLNYRGTLFTQASFLNYVLNSLKNSATGLNYYYRTSSTESTEGTTNEYRQVATGDIKFVGINGETGKVDMVLANPDAEIFYKTVNAETGAERYVSYGNNCDLQARLTAVQGQTPLYWYNQGTSVYYIPVEHNALKSMTDKAVDGYYGVVRNHWYTLSVNSFSRVGHAIYDPENGSEQLKPSGSEDPLYYVGASIKVVSWRLVKQDIDL